jgi:hypothetical protein
MTIKTVGLFFLPLPEKFGDVCDQVRLRLSMCDMNVLFFLLSPSRVRLHLPRTPPWSNYLTRPDL